MVGGRQYTHVCTLLPVLCLEYISWLLVHKSVIQWFDAQTVVRSSQCHGRALMWLLNAVYKSMFDSCKHGKLLVK